PDTAGGARVISVKERRGEVCVFVCVGVGVRQRDVYVYIERGDCLWPVRLCITFSPHYSLSPFLYLSLSRVLSPPLRSLPLCLSLTFASVARPCPILPMRIRRPSRGCHDLTQTTFVSSFISLPLLGHAVTRTISGPMPQGKYIC